MMTRTIKTYSQLILLPTFKERFEYVQLSATVGQYTFGLERYLNQQFYRSKKWKRLRDQLMIRDSVDGYVCDLGHPDYPIFDNVIIHHLNPITIEDIETQSDNLLNPEFLVCVAHRTHNAIHYGDFDLLPKDYVPRQANDTCPWRL